MRHGAPFNPPNRFGELSREPDPEGVPPEAPGIQLLPDQSRTVLASNDSPDLRYGTTLNPYRGCEQGCAYCYARPYHEYLGFSAGLDFETRLLVKYQAPERLREALSSPSYRPRIIGLSGVTDPYQPVERKLRLTRRCLEVLAEFRNPVVAVTKNRLVARDADLFGVLARHGAAAVFLSVTTLEDRLARNLEPRASRPADRLEAIARLARAGVPVGAMVAPVIPGLNDHEIPAILKAVRDAGGRYAEYAMLRLPHGVKEIFSRWLETHLPHRKEKILNRLRAVRGGRLNDPRFGSRMRGEGLFAGHVARLFELSCRRLGLSPRAPELSTAAFRRPGPVQLELF